MRPAALTLRRFVGVLLALAVVLGVALVLGSALGAGSIDLGALLSGQASPVERTILFEVRLPRVLLAAVLGAALSVSGVAFQALLRNPLADPYILGVSGGASLGGVLALVLGLGVPGGADASFGVPLFAFLGALAALVLVERLASVGGRLGVTTMLLVGVIVNATASAVIFFVQSIASLEELHAIVFYLMGSIPSHGLGTVAVLAAVTVLGALALATMARDYDLLSLGEEGAQQLGVDVEAVKRRSFVVGCLLTGLAVSVAGLVGFVGLVVPHLLRLSLGPDHRLLLPAAFLGGGAFLVIADLVSRTVAAPTEIPVGVVTALVGGPFFLFLLRRRDERHVF